jgi:hypothetical protein
MKNEDKKMLIVKMFLDIGAKRSTFPFKQMEFRISPETQMTSLGYNENSKRIDLFPTNEGYDVVFGIKGVLFDSWIEKERLSTAIAKPDFTIENIINKAIDLIDILYKKHF